MRGFSSTNTVLFKEDIPDKYVNYVRKAKTVAWDIETSGLDWRKDRVGICQLYVPDEPVAIIKVSRASPKNLRSLLSDPSIKKVFHHAMFDLRFMSYHWKVLPRNIACTKIASKILEVGNRDNHTLKSIANRYLGVVIAKDERLSNWLSDKLTKEQINYATKDVIYLLRLLEVLERKLESKGLLQLAHMCFAHIPARVQLDILGYADVYTY